MVREAIANRIAGLTTQPSLPTPSGHSGMAALEAPKKAICGPRHLFLGENLALEVTICPVTSEGFIERCGFLLFALRLAQWPTSYFSFWLRFYLPGPKVPLGSRDTLAGAGVFIFCSGQLSRHFAFIYLLGDYERRAGWHQINRTPTGHRKWPLCGVQSRGRKPLQLAANPGRSGFVRRICEVEH